MCTGGSFKNNIVLTDYYNPHRSFSVYFTVTQNGVEYNLEWWQSKEAENNHHYIALPRGAEDSDIKINFTAYDSLTVNGENYKNGDSIKVEDFYNITAGEEKYSLEVFPLSEIPALHIVTDDGVTELVDKEVKKSGYAVFMNKGKVIFDDRLESIKGRGNVTWGSWKKGFTITTEKYTELLGMDKSNKWVILPNTYDNTDMKNTVVLSLAQVVGLEYTTDCRYVDLFINGVYWGNYLLCEKVEIAQGRVDITNLEKKNRKANQETDFTDPVQGGEYGPGSEAVYGSQKWIEMPYEPEFVNGGYLMELQPYYRYDKGVSGFITDYGQTVVLRGPEHATENQIKYISGYYQDFENALISPDGYNRKGRHYSDYIDMESFAKMYLLQEYSLNYDAGLTSTFIYKDKNEKMFAGPVWDFDYSGIKVGKTTLENSRGEYVASLKLYVRIKDGSEKYTIFTLLWQHRDFRRLCREIWEKEFLPYVPDFAESIDRLYNEIYISATTDRFRWHKSSNGRPFDDVTDSYREYVDGYIFFLENRADFMTEFVNR